MNSIIVPCRNTLMKPSLQCRTVFRHCQWNTQVQRSHDDKPKRSFEVLSGNNIDDADNETGDVETLLKFYRATSL